MLGLYVTKVTVFSEGTFQEQDSYSIYPGYNLHDVMQKIEEDYGEDNIITASATRISCPDEGPSITISESLAKALIYDYPAMLEVPNTTLYQKMKGKIL